MTNITGNFIDNNYIQSLLQGSDTKQDIDKILDKAGRYEGLNHREVASLFTTQSQTHIDRIFEIAGQIKKRIYGDRIVLFAPLYVSDYCINHCSYCGFRGDGTQARRKLDQDEVRAEVAILEKMGHKRLAIEAGEDPENCPLDYILECIDTIYRTSDIRRVNVNIAATDVDDYRRLRDAQIGTSILFQETYHRPTYEKVHLSGPKSDYNNHLTAFDRAMEAGIDDVGAGVLFGLYDFRYEALALMIHNEHLEERFGVGFHTISVPRIKKVSRNQDVKHVHGAKHDQHVKIDGDYSSSSDVIYDGIGVSDQDFLKLVAILRLAVPFTGMIVSTRESPEMRRKLIKVGISQMSAGSRTAVGGYSEPIKYTTNQFDLSDHRDAKEIIYWLMEEDLLPSFCTACYRRGRSGDRFMELAKSGDIKNVCLPNGLLTLKEYALDYGDERFNTLADRLIAKYLNNIENKTIVQSKLELLKHGERDLFI